MNRLPTALLATLEAAIAAVVGLAAVLVPMTLLWAVQFGLHADFVHFWRATGAVWLLGHGVDVRFALDERLAASLGVDPSAAAFPVTVALLGLGLVTALFARRIGARAAGAGHPFVGVAASAGVLAAVGWLTSLTSTSAAVAPAHWQAVLLPAAVAGVAAAVGAAGEVLRTRSPGDEPTGPLAARLADLPEGLVDGVRAAVRGGVAAAAMLFGVAGAVVTVLIAVTYADMVGLYETLQTGVVGGIALTVGELAALPNLVVWTASWLLGPGFALGDGSAVSPFEHAVGPVPAVPLAAIVPGGTGVGWFALLLPVVVGAAAGLLLQRTDEPLPMRPALVRAAGAAVVGAALVGLFAWWSGGAIGPGRLAVVGPQPWLVAAAALLVVGLPLVVATALAVAVDHRVPVMVPRSRILPADRLRPAAEPATDESRPSAAARAVIAGRPDRAPSARTGAPAESDRPRVARPWPAWSNADATGATGEAVATGVVSAAESPSRPADAPALAGRSSSDPRPEPRTGAPTLRGRPASPVGRRIPDASPRREAPVATAATPPPLRVGLTDPRPETRPVPLPPPDPDELPWWRRPPEHRDDA